jgi:Uma2 family endonuclease
VVRPVIARAPYRHVREPEPLFFPSSEEMPETRRHLGLRTALFQILELAFADRATLGSEQFVYWDPTNPRVSCAPDVMLRLGEPDEPFDNWKVWEWGAPHLAIEIVSPSDADRAPWEEKLQRYRSMGVLELVRFDADDAELPFRIWDRPDFDLVERERALPDFARCRTLDAYFCVKHDDRLGAMLRLARDAEGRDLFPTPAEARIRAEEERARADEERARADEERVRANEARRQAEEARLVAEARVRELEAELARRARD